MEPGRYLERIGYDGPVQPNRETLRRLHLQHLLHVPFENLDIHLGRPLSLAMPDFYAKIVERRRGGFCYELNGLFGWLLGELGFEVSRLSARVVGSQGPGPEYDHLTLLVCLEDRWLADVGFGEGFVEPLRLDGDGPQLDGRAEHRIVGSETGRFGLDRRVPGGEWEPQYLFTTRPRQMGEFEARCRHHQTSPESHFTQKPLCTRLTAAGRVTLSGRTLIETAAGRRSETPLADEAEWRSVLRDRFGVLL